jgi:hypothetical protein
MDDHQIATSVKSNDETVGTLESEAQTSSNLIFLQAFSCTCDSVRVCATLIKNNWKGMKAKQQFSQAQIPLFVFDLISNLPLLLCGI